MITCQKTKGRRKKREVEGTKVEGRRENILKRQKVQNKKKSEGQEGRKVKRAKEQKVGRTKGRLKKKLKGGVKTNFTVLTSVFFQS